MNQKVLLSLLWVVLVVNYIFCDVFTLMHSEDLKNLLQGKAGDVALTQEFLLGFAVVMEIPMLMIVLSRVLPLRWNRVANLAFAPFLVVVQIWSLTVDSATLHYWFFSIIEIGILAAIIAVAFQLKAPLNPR